MKANEKKIKKKDLNKELKKISQILDKYIRVNNEDVSEKTKKNIEKFIEIGFYFGRELKFKENILKK